MRAALLIFCLAAAGCAAKVDPLGSARPEVLRDIEGYAIASCLAIQNQPYLKDQGDAWAAVIVQRMKGNLDNLVEIFEQVKNENGKGEMAVIRDEATPGGDKMLPVLYCNEIVDRVAVRAAIQKAVAALNHAYTQQQ